MNAYHITGASGSGKSHVGRELGKRGFRVIETDFEPGLSDWAHKETRQRAEEPRQPFPTEWVEAHGWYWDRDKMHELVEGTGDVPVFFVGGAHNETEFYPLFRKRFGLFIDDKDELTRRLQEREPERWIDGSQELTNVLEWNDKSRAFNEQHGAISIDSSQPVETIADVILKHVDGDT